MATRKKSRKKTLYGESQSPLFGAQGKPETSGERRDIRIGEAKSGSVTQAPKATTRQKRRAAELAGSVVGGPIAGKLLGKAAGALAGRAASKGAPNVIRAGAPKPQVKLPTPKPIRGTDQTSGPTIRAGQGDPSKGAIPAVRRPTTPATTPKPRTEKGKIVGLSPLGKAITGATLGGGAIYGVKKLYDTVMDSSAGKASAETETKTKPKKSNKKVKKKKVADTRRDSPHPPIVKLKTKSPPKPAKKAKKWKSADPLYDKPRSKNMIPGDYKESGDYLDAFEENIGAKKGGRLSSTNLKSKRKSGFSGKGAGAALRGF